MLGIDCDLDAELGERRVVKVTELLAKAVEGVNEIPDEYFSYVKSVLPIVVEELGIIFCLLAKHASRDTIKRDDVTLLIRLLRVAPLSSIQAIEPSPILNKDEIHDKIKSVTHMKPDSDSVELVLRLVSWAFTDIVRRSVHYSQLRGSKVSFSDLLAACRDLPWPLSLF